MKKNQQKKKDRSPNREVLRVGGMEVGEGAGRLDTDCCWTSELHNDWEKRFSFQNCPDHETNGCIDKLGCVSLKYFYHASPDSIIIMKWLVNAKYISSTLTKLPKCCKGLTLSRQALTRVSHKHGKLGSHIGYDLEPVSRWQPLQKRGSVT